MIKNKVALITGASSGIGKATAIEFAKLGANLILTARRVEKIQELASQLEQEYGVKVLALKLDVQDSAMVEKTITNLTGIWQEIDILVNNAGLALSSDLMQNAKVTNWDTMIDTNIKGLLYVTHAVLPIMTKRKIGHIVNISSMAGIEHYPMGNVYSATKHAVRAISKSLRLDLLGQNIRVSDIAPGAVYKEFSTVRWQDKQKADNFYSTFTPLTAEDIADAVTYCVTRKPHVNVDTVALYPTEQASANHICKNGVPTAGLWPTEAK